MDKNLRFISECFNLNYREDAKIRLDRLIGNNLDWSFILKKLTLSDILPLAFSNLSSLKNQEIPEWFLKKLEDSYNYTVTKNLYLWKTLKEISDLFSAENIPLLSLKGIFMVDLIYKNISLRTLGDIDMLVRQSDLGRIERILSKSGYLKRKGNSFAVQYENRSENAFTKNNGFCIDLHYKINLPSPLKIDPGFLWSNATTESIEGRNTLYPSLEDSLIYSALHFFHHFSESFLFQLPCPSLKSILDIHEIISSRNRELNWRYIESFAGQNKIKNIVYFALALARRIFQTPLTLERISGFKPGCIKNTAICMTVNDYFNLAGKGIAKCSYAWHKMLLAYLSLFEGTYFLRVLFYSPREFATRHKLPFPSAQTFLKYGLRPFFYLKVACVSIFKKCL